jgi:hypothetical protein
LLNLLPDLIGFLLSLPDKPHFIQNLSGFLLSRRQDFLRVPLRLPQNFLSAAHNFFSLQISRRQVQAHQIQLI